MAAYEKLTDSIVDRIICSNDNNLEESREILMKVKIRQLYKFVGQTHPHEKVMRIWIKHKYNNRISRNPDCKKHFFLNSLDKVHVSKGKIPWSNICTIN